MKVAIFNGIPFHYETFGVFLYCIKTCGHDVTVFTNRGFETGWFEFYKNLYGDWLHIRNHTDFNEEEFDNHDSIILTTDDDSNFNEHFLVLRNGNNKVLAYDHSKLLRRPTIKHHVGTRPFITGGRPELPYMYACYPMVTKLEKHEALQKEDTINITLVGGIENIDKYTKFLHSKNDCSKIKLYIVRRWWCDSLRPKLELSNIPYELLIGLDTTAMFELLKKSHYMMFTDVEHHTFNSSSGGVGLSISTGCTMIVPENYNTDYKFKNALHFEDCPELSKMPDLDIMYDEQTEIINHNLTIFEDFINKRGYYSM